MGERFGVGVPSQSEIPARRLPALEAMILEGSDGNAAAEAKRIDLDRIERCIRRIVELITDYDAPVRALKQELVDLEARQLTLQHELTATDAPAPLIHPNLAEVYRQRVARLHDALCDPTTRDEVFALIRSLIDEIRLVPENGELRIELRGALAGILGLAADSKKPGGLSAAGLLSKSRWLRGLDLDFVTFSTRRG
jgi:site-specific DNA recombinase